MKEVTLSPLQIFLIVLLAVQTPNTVAADVEDISQDETPNGICSSQVTHVLREIRDALVTPETGGCPAQESPNRPRDKSDQLMEIVTSSFKQQGNLLISLRDQTETLRLSTTSVSHAMANQQERLTSMRDDFDMERATIRQQSRDIQDIQMEVNKIQKLLKSQAEEIRRQELEMQDGLKKLQLDVESVQDAVKTMGDTTSSLGDVIGRLQGSLQMLERSISRHDSSRGVVANPLRSQKGSSASRVLVSNRKAMNLTQQGNKSPRRRAMTKPLTSDDDESDNEELVVETVRLTDTESEYGLLDCPHPYQRVGNGCFTIHSEERLSWNAANNYCRDLDGSLAQPVDVFDLILFLDGLFPASYSDAGGWGFWVGSRLDRAGKWRWTSGLPVTITKDFWGRGEPGNAEGQKEGCMYLHSWWRFRAGADPCLEKKNFICEQKVPLAPLSN